MTSRLSLTFCAIAIVTAMTGCSQGTVGIGDQQPSTQLKTGLAAFAANWDGYVANSCAIASNLPQDIQLDAALENNQQTMTGTLALGGTNYTVRLRRQ